MQDISFSLTAVVFLALIALLVAAVVVPAEVGTPQNVRTVPLSGRIVVIQETSYMNFTTTEVEEDSRLRFTRDSEGPVVIHAVAWGRSPTERVVEIHPQSIEAVHDRYDLGVDGTVRLRRWGVAISGRGGGTGRGVPHCRDSWMEKGDGVAQ